MHIAYSLDPLEPAPSLFLAGPTPRDYQLPRPELHWRAEALTLLETADFGGTVYVPEDRGWKLRANFDVVAQRRWEQAALSASDVTVFWVCRDQELRLMPGFTTNVEWGRVTREAELLGKKKFVLGYPEGTRKVGYMHDDAEALQAPIRHTLAGTLQAALALLPPS